jgi:hypothetical protein
MSTATVGGCKDSDTVSIYGQKSNMFMAKKTDVLSSSTFHYEMKETSFQWFELTLWMSNEPNTEAGKIFLGLGSFVPVIIH